MPTTADVLDLAGRQVLAAADDDVVESAVDEAEALGVEVARVSGGEPAVGWAGFLPRYSPDTVQRSHAMLCYGAIDDGWANAMSAARSSGSTKPALMVASASAS